MTRPEISSETDLKTAFVPQELTAIDASGQMCVARFRPGRDELFAGGYDAHVHRWHGSGDNYASLAALPGHNGWVQNLCFSSEGRLLFSADSWGRLTCHDVSDSNTPQLWSHPEAHTGGIQALAVAPSNQWVASGGHDGSVRLWSVTNGKPLRSLSTSGVPVHSLACDPAGQLLAVGDLLGNITLWSPVEGMRLKTLDATELYTEHRLQQIGGVRCLLFSPDGRTLLAAGTRPKNGGNVQGVPLLLQFDSVSGERLRALELGTTSDVYVRDIVWHPRGFLIVVTSGNPGTGKLLLIEPPAEKPFFLEAKYGNCHSVTLTDDGRRFAVLTTSKGSNGNGRRLDKDGHYAGNTSPIRVLEFSEAAM